MRRRDGLALGTATDNNYVFGVDSRVDFGNLHELPATNGTTGHQLRIPFQRRLARAPPRWVLTTVDSIRSGTNPASRSFEADGVLFSL